MGTQNGHNLPFRGSVSLKERKRRQWKEYFGALGLLFQNIGHLEYREVPNLCQVIGDFFFSHNKLYPCWKAIKNKLESAGLISHSGLSAVVNIDHLFLPYTHLFIVNSVCSLFIFLYFWAVVILQLMFNRMISTMRDSRGQLRICEGEVRRFMSWT